MGNLGESLDGWVQIPLKDLLTKQHSATMNLDCADALTHLNENNHDTFYLTAVSHFGLSGLNISNMTHTHPRKELLLKNIPGNDSCKSLTSNFKQDFSNDCYNNKKCEVEIDVLTLDCQNLLNREFEKAQKEEKQIFMTVNFKCICAENIFFFINSISLRKALLSYIWVIWDSCIILLVAFFFFRLNYYMRKETNRIKKNRMTADYYTVQIRNLPEFNPAQLYGNLFNFFENLSPKTQVADIGIGMADKLIKINFEIGNLKRKLVLVEKNIRSKEKKMHENGIETLQGLRDERAEISAKIKELEQKQEKMEASSKTVIKTVFVTFMKEEGAQYVAYNYTKFANSNKLFRLFRQKKIRKF